MFAKKCFLLLLSAAGAFAQLPLRQDPKAVAATVDGRDLTWGEVNQILAVAPPQLVTYFKQNPQGALMQWFIMQELGRQGEAKKLDQQSPLKEQLDAMRMNYLADARMNEEMNLYPVPLSAVEDFYKKNQARFERVRVSGVLVKFKAETKAGATSAADVAAAAAAILQGAGIQRSETDARALAVDLVKRLRAGESMKTIVAQYSEDDASKGKGGDIGYVSGTSPLPAEIVKASVALRQGDISEPVRLSTGFFVLRADERSVQPMNEVVQEISEEIRKVHLDQFLKGLNDRFRPVIKDPMLMVQPTTK
jgi:parvulin-like peptidyl-prolyl isomerase